MKHLGLILILLFLLIGVVTAQEDGASTVQYLFTPCESQAVIDLTGNIGSGYDIYLQVFKGSGAGGEAVSDVRRVVVDGTYQVSAVIPYKNTMAKGELATATISMASESDPTKTIYATSDTVVVQDCVEPTHPLVDTSGSQTGEGGQPGRELIDSAGIFTPSGTRLNPIYSYTESVVQIGARPSEKKIPGRTENPGLIFAECAAYPKADPGVIFDTDTLYVYWSWFAKTKKQVQDHLDNSRYSVTLNGQELPPVSVSPIQRMPGSVNYWVFYTVNLGNAWKPGDYGIAFKLEWENAISDGYDEYGPGTENFSINGGCGWKVQANPWNTEVVPQNPKSPLKGY